MFKGVPAWDSELCVEKVQKVKLTRRIGVNKTLYIVWMQVSSQYLH